MKFLVTGATGFIGKHLCHKLIQEGHHVVALVRNPHKLAGFLLKNLEILSGDLASFSNPDFVIPECDKVIHLAGTVTATKQTDYDKNNFIAVKNLVGCLKKQKWRPRRILFCSSLAACGPSSETTPLTENSKPQPIDAYGRAKLEAEKFLLTQKDFPVTVFRPCTVIGPMDENVYNLYKLAKHGFGFKVCGLNQKLSFIAVSDLVNVVCKLTEDTSSQNKTYFVSHDEPTDVLGLWREIEKSLGKKIRLIPLPKPLLYLAMMLNTGLANILPIRNALDKKYYDQLHAKAWLCSSKKLQQDFNWKPAVSLEEVFKATAESYKNAGWI